MNDDSRCKCADYPNHQIFFEDSVICQEYLYGFEGYDEVLVF